MLYIIWGLAIAAIGVVTVVAWKQKVLGAFCIAGGIAICLMTIFSAEPAEKKVVPVDTKTSFAEMYRESQKNEARADDKYAGKRYQITAKINGISDGGWFSRDRITLTLEKEIDKKHVFFYAKFGEDEREKIKQFDTGDKITFQGEYSSIGSWRYCKVVGN